MHISEITFTRRISKSFEIGHALAHKGMGLLSTSHRKVALCNSNTLVCVVCLQSRTADSGKRFPSCVVAVADFLVPWGIRGHGSATWPRYMPLVAAYHL